MAQWLRVAAYGSAPVFPGAGIAGLGRRTKADDACPHHALLPLPMLRRRGLHHPQRAAFELLLRKLLLRPDPPAVLLLHHYW